MIKIDNIIKNYGKRRRYSNNGKKGECHEKSLLYDKKVGLKIKEEKTIGYMKLSAVEISRKVQNIKFGVYCNEEVK
jgi:hypothetical protein